MGQQSQDGDYSTAPENCSESSLPVVVMQYNLALQIRGVGLQD
jgi:hypothetical protein